MHTQVTELYHCMLHPLCRSSGKVYHVLIFHKGGQYSLDIADREGDTPTLFSSLDDLVVFCMSHQMKMEGDEVKLPSKTPSSQLCIVYTCMCIMCMHMYNCVMYVCMDT